MDRVPINTEIEMNNKYDFLMRNLLNGSITIEEVRNRLIKWDQDTPSREASDENLVFLQDPRIIEYIEKHPEARQGYHAFVSFTEFHVAQRLALNNSVDAIEHFKKSLENARVCRSNESWVAYVEGTLLYMNGKEIPEELIEKVDSPRNAQILRNFNKGLTERGFASYMEDY